MSSIHIYLLSILSSYIIQTDSTVYLPAHRLLKRWAVDLADPAPEPSEDTSNIDNTSIATLWISLSTSLTFLLIVALFCYCLYPFRRFVWLLIRLRFQTIGDAVDTMEFGNLNTHSGPQTTTEVVSEPSVLEGRNNTVPIQVNKGNVEALVNIMAALVIQGSNIGSTVSPSTTE